jgi:hypothetical protein
MTQARTSFLEAVNRVLQMMGEAPINSLEGQYGLAQQAQDVLDDTSRQVQADSWSFNTDRRALLSRNNDDEIPVGVSVVRVVVDSLEYPGLDVVQRGAKLYDRSANSYEFDQDLRADVTYVLEWEELPEYARQYITVRAGRVLQESIIGSADLSRINQQQEAEVRAMFLDEETAVNDHNMIGGNPNHSIGFLPYMPLQALRRR